MDTTHASSRRPKRKPLGDLTNTPSLSSPAAGATSASAHKAKLKPRSFVAPKSSASSNAPNISATCSSTTDSSSPANPISSKACVTSLLRSQTSSGPVCAASNSECSESSTSDKAQRSSKDMNVVNRASSAGAFSCPPLRKYSTTGRKKQEGGSLSISNSAPCQKKIKRARRTDPAEYELPQDFVEERKAYFEELDAFELQEELVSENELE